MFAVDVMREPRSYDTGQISVNDVSDPQWHQLKKVVKLNSTYFHFFHTHKFCNANNSNTASQAVCNVYCLLKNMCMSSVCPAYGIV